MSYLDVPRIHVAGRFFTDPSTINNDPKHYDPACAQPSPWQEPNGNHYFRLVDCTVRSALDARGPVTSDPIIGSPVRGTDQPSPAKIVDLDVYQQGVSTIFGFQLEIELDAHSKLVGDMLPPSLNGIWFQRVLPTRGWNQDYGWGSYGGDANASGSFQTQVRVAPANWPEGSRVLNTLRAATTTDADGNLLISLKFVLDSYQNVATDAGYRHGRFTGSLGPVTAGEPVQTPGARWLAARPLPAGAAWYVPAFNAGPFQVDEKRRKLVVDLANCLCQESVGGAPVDLGTLQAVAGETVIGAVDYSQIAYENNAGIAELDVDAAQIEALSCQPLRLISSRQDIGAQVVLVEDAAGLNIAVDQRVFRMTSEPDSALRKVTTQVYVRQWGQPVEGVQLRVSVVPVKGDTPGNTGTPGSPGDTFDADGVLVATCTPTNARGVATVTLEAVKNPFSRTPELDGQLYFVYVHQGTDLPAGAPQETQISVLVWSQYPIDENPSWEAVRALMVPYAKLYPAMTQRIDLTDEHSFKIFADNPPWCAAYGCSNDYNVMGIKAGAIPFYMTRDFDDPRYMPVSRDLSPNKVATILHWIKNQQPPYPPGGFCPPGDEK